jgi:hypothetical protein
MATSFARVPACPDRVDTAHRRSKLGVDRHRASIVGLLERLEVLRERFDFRGRAIDDCLVELGEFVVKNGNFRFELRVQGVRNFPHGFAMFRVVR